MALGWAPAEIGLFVDSLFKQGKPLARISAAEVRGSEALAKVESSVPIKLAELHYTNAEGEWKPRQWQTMPVSLNDNLITAPLPSQRPLVFYLSITDDRNALVSTPHVILEKP